DDHAPEEEEEAQQQEVVDHGRAPPAPVRVAPVLELELVSRRDGRRGVHPRLLRWEEVIEGGGNRSGRHLRLPRRQEIAHWGSLSGGAAFGCTGEVPVSGTQTSQSGYLMTAIVSPVATEPPSDTFSSSTFPPL